MISTSNISKHKALLAIHAESQQDRVISIDFPEDGLRARKVISRSNSDMSGKWPSFKMGRAMHYESGNERNAFKLLDASPEVRSYSEQPCVIHYMIDGEVHRHYPDILVNFSTHQELWEVKTDTESKNPEIMRRSELMAKYLPTFGYLYQIAIAEDLKINPRLNNVVFLLKHGRRTVSLVEYEQIRQLFKRNTFLEWGYFQFGAIGAAYLKPICRLILDGLLELDINQPLQMLTEIRYNHKVKGAQ